MSSVVSSAKGTGPSRAEDAPIERCPLPVPLGWFFVSYSEELKPGELRNIQYFGQEWVLFRTEGGEAGVVDPYCAHLGAHIGKGGKVDGEAIRCPFHHWAYSTKGWCTKIPYAKVMPPITKRQAILRALPVTEKHGIVWAWYHPKREPPMWEVPDIPELHDPNYIAPQRGEWPVNTFIQELGENGVDFAHLKYLHHSPVIPTGTCRADGIWWHVDMANGMIVIEQAGPGLQVVRFRRANVVTTMVSYPTPVSKSQTIMRMGLTHLRYPEGSQEAHIAADYLKEQIGQGSGEQAGFESVDMIVWNNKCYRERPLLCDGDGEILKWRKYFSQFYVS
ncbi:MAG TPA: Rieske 2Fe-2S domain-containing protein [Steroidobacteraceae bacterium]|nr:Rieske 2Fe-2S domain-containing protein [Steroidobacteraceae bacterium]